VLNRCLKKNPDDRYQKADDILLELKGTRSGDSKVSQDTLNESPAKNRTTKILQRAGIISVFIICILLFWYLNQRIPQEYSIVTHETRKSIAVLPFKNLTGESNLDIWQQGLPKILVSELSTAEDLQIIDVVENMGPEQVNTLGATLIPFVSSKDNIDMLLHGDLIKAGKKLRIDATLQDASSGEIMKSVPVEGSDEENLIQDIKEISHRLKSFFDIKSLQQNVDIEL
jgi:TolB-like protein